jgi:helicase HerA-like protein
VPAPLLVAKSKSDLALLPAMANRHGLITGATGTGKTVTLQALAERFSAIGVPVFLADVKGDLAGLAAAGGNNAKVAERVKALELEPFDYHANPVILWDVFGQSGHPMRPEERRGVIDGSLVAGHYEKAIDRESAYERLKTRTESRGGGAAPTTPGGLGGILDTLGLPGGGRR